MKQTLDLRRLRTETNTPAMEKRVLTAARKVLGSKRDLRATFEHGRWWLEDFTTEAQWLICDEESEIGFCFYLTEGEG
jgi:hypothetical protein